MFLQIYVRTKSQNIKIVADISLKLLALSSDISFEMMIFIEDHCQQDDNMAY